MGGSHKIFYTGSPIGSVPVLAKTLDVSDALLARIESDPPAFYNVFEKTVRNKSRILCDPRAELKTIQKRIISRIFRNIVFPHYLHGGIKAEDSRDFVSNAAAHYGAEVAIAIDIKSYFPSITTAQVNRVFQYLFKFPADVSTLLTALTTLNGNLPQGAATSSYIANLVMWEKEYKLAAKLEGKGLVYTRLIDDITVSSKKALPSATIGKVTTDVLGMLKSYGFEQNAEKYFVYSRSNPKKLMTVTGLWLNRGAPRISKDKRKEISTQAVRLHKAAQEDGARFDETYHQEFNSVSGKVALLGRLRHKEGERLRRLIGEVPPIFDESRKLKTKRLVLMFCKKPMDRSKLSYSKRFYQLQHEVAVVKRTDRGLAKMLQGHLNKRVPTKTMREFYE